MDESFRLRPQRPSRSQLRPLLPLLPLLQPLLSLWEESQLRLWRYGYYTPSRHMFLQWTKQNNMNTCPLQSPTPGRAAAPPSIPRTVLRKQQLYSAGKPSTVHTKDKLMRWEKESPLSTLMYSIADPRESFPSRQDQTSMRRRREWLVRKSMIWSIDNHFLIRIRSSSWRHR